MGIIKKIFGTMRKQTVQLPDVKKVLGNPKITFVLGGPASGKGTQC